MPRSGPSSARRWRRPAATSSGSSGPARSPTPNDPGRRRPRPDRLRERRRDREPRDPRRRRLADGRATIPIQATISDAAAREMDLAVGDRLSLVEPARPGRDRDVAITRHLGRRSGRRALARRGARDDRDDDRRNVHDPRPARRPRGGPRRTSAARTSRLQVSWRGLPDDRQPPRRRRRCRCAPARTAWPAACAASSRPSTSPRVTTGLPGAPRRRRPVGPRQPQRRDPADDPVRGPRRLRGRPRRRDARRAAPVRDRADAIARRERRPTSSPWPCSKRRSSRCRRRPSPRSWPSASSALLGVGRADGRPRPRRARRRSARTRSSSRRSPALACIVALTLPTLFVSASPAGARAASGRQARTTLAQRLGLDLALVAVAGVALWQLRLYGAPLTRNVRGHARARSAARRGAGDRARRRSRPRPAGRAPDRRARRAAPRPRSRARRLARRPAARPPAAPLHPGRAAADARGRARDAGRGPRRDVDPLAGRPGRVRRPPPTSGRSPSDYSTLADVGGRPAVPGDPGRRGGHAAQRRPVQRRADGPRRLARGHRPGCSPGASRRPRPPDRRTAATIVLDPLARRGRRRRPRTPLPGRPTRLALTVDVHFERSAGRPRPAARPSRARRSRRARLGSPRRS